MGKKKDQQLPAPVSMGAQLSRAILRTTPGGRMVDTAIELIEKNGGLKKTAEDALELRGKKKQQDVAIRGQKQKQDRETYTSQKTDSAFGLSVGSVELPNGIKIRDIKIGAKTNKKKNYKD